MESDPEGVPWREALFTNMPEIVQGQMKVPTAPGWGCDLVEKAAIRYAWSS